MKTCAYTGGTLAARLLVLCLLIVGTPISGQTGAASSPLFDSHEPLSLTLALDLEAARSDIGDDRSYHAATITLLSGDSVLPAVPVRIRTRGNFRRRPENCDFPPFRLNFRKKDVAETLWANQDKLKLVNHCRDFDPRYEQHVLLEYLVYRGLNLLTPESFRVRLVNLTYVDTSGDNQPLIRPAFFVEADKELAIRISGGLDDRNPVPREAFDQGALSLLFLYQYLIGNIDWDHDHPHNMVNVRRKKNKRVVAVPYDFDFAQIVGQVRSDDFPLIGPKAHRHELFSDLCLTREDMAESIDLFRSRKDDLYSLFTLNDFLDDDAKELSIRHLDRFYQTLDDEALITREFIRPCRRQS